MFITAFLPSHTTSFLIQFYSQGKYFHLSCRQKTLRLAWACGIKFYMYTPSSVWVMSVLKAKQAQALPFTFCAAIWLPTLVWLINISCDLQISSERSEHIETEFRQIKAVWKLKRNFQYDKYLFILLIKMSQSSGFQMSHESLTTKGSFAPLILLFGSSEGFFLKY